MNHNFKASWDKINPDVAAEHRMLNEAMRRVHAADKGGNLMSTKNPLRTALIAAALVCVLAVSVFAAVKLLTPVEVAEWFDPEIAKAFKGPGAQVIDETKTAGDYEITLLGIAPAQNFSVRSMSADGQSVTSDEEKIFAAFAVRRKNGATLPADLACVPINVWPLIQGVDPSKHFFDGGGVGSERDGVMYYLADCNELFPFADRQVFLSVSDCLDQTEKQYFYDEVTGNHIPNPAYQGVNVLFELPLDASKADPVRAAQLLEQAARNALLPENTPNPFLKIIANIPLEQCSLLEDSVKTCTPDIEGKISYSYESQSEMRSFLVDIPDRVASEMEFDEQGYSKERFYSPYADDFLIGAFHRDTNGEITAMMWAVPESLSPQ